MEFNQTVAQIDKSEINDQIKKLYERLIEINEEAE